MALYDFLESFGWEETIPSSLLTPMMARRWPEGMSPLLAFELVDRVNACLGPFGCCHQSGLCSFYHMRRVGEEKRVNLHHGEGEKRYLQLDLGSSKGRRLREYAHRIMAWARWGPGTREASVAMHLCSNEGGKCVNPLHLALGSVTTNTLDALTKRGGRRLKRVAGGVRSEGGSEG